MRAEMCTLYPRDDTSKGSLLGLQNQLIIYYKSPPVHMRLSNEYNKPIVAKALMRQQMHMYIWPD